MLSALVLSSFLILVVLVNGRTPVVTLDYGTFTGVRDDNTGIVSFRGIRYADAPVGELRWRQPISPPSKHLGHVNATQFRDNCVQTTQTTITPGSSEDCLFANVYIPSTAKANQTLPVLVYFHGGGFQGGSTHDFDPIPMMQPPASPVVFATFEYRLGQFGFLGGTRVKENGSLNVGLLDQRAALRWLQRYIEEFGGDKSKVAIWGESAGAGSTMYHLLGDGGDPNGLFRVAMGDSPSLNFMPLYNSSYVEGIFDQIASFVGCEGENIMACLRRANGNKLALAGSQTISARSATLFTFAPILDDAFLREQPVEAFANGHFAHIPVLFGSNTDEGANWSASLSDASANTSMPNATQTTVYNFLHGQYADLTRASFNRAVEEFYPLSDFANFSLQGQQMYGEMRYICTASLIAGSAFAQSVPSFQFHYNNPILGSDHGAELIEFFTASPLDKEDSRLSVVMREFWTNFVLNEVPSAKDISTVWDPAAHSNGSPRILLQPGAVAMEDITTNLTDRCTFWHSLSRELGV